MVAEIIDGKAFAAKLRQEIKTEIATLPSKVGLAVVIVGDNPASHVYVKNKVKQTKEVGMESFHHELPEDVSEKTLLELINKLNHDAKIHGILVQLPLPKHLSEDAVIQAITPEKDVDGFHVINSGKLATGQQGFVPCTPLGCSLMLKDTLGDLSGKHAVVIGRSNIVGKPMAQLLLGANATPTIAHSRTKDLADVVRQADIVVAAVGRPEMVPGDWIKPGATVIDVGINRVPAPEKGEGKHKIVGDVHFESAEKVAGAITPVPGGVGPMTIACLLANTVTAAARSANLPEPEGLTA